LLLTLFSFSSGFLYPQQTSYGDSASLGNGMIKGWVKTDDSNNPQSIGLNLTEEVLSNLPDQQTTISLDLPKNTSDTLFKHIYFGWNPMGHPPAGIYTLPHFDLHFYIIDKQERLAIPGGPDPVKVEPRFVPPDYVSDPAGVPQMGTHWTDTTAPEFHGHTFDKTFIYGYAKGKFVFYELMFTKVYLESHPHFSGSIKQPAEFQKAGYYPRTYKVNYDSTNHLYNFEIIDFIWHNAAEPASIPLAHLNLWLKSDTGTVMNGTKVSRWMDQSGNGNDAVESDSSRQPLLINDALNGKPVVSFDGVNDRLGFTGSKRMLQISLFIVFNNKSGATGTTAPGFVLTFGPGGPYSANQHFAIKMRGMDNGDNDIIIGTEDHSDFVMFTGQNIAKYNEWRNLSIIRDRTVSNTTLRWNGIDAPGTPSGSNFSIYVPLGDSTASGGGIGSTDNFPDLGRVLAKCDIAEIIVYDTVLSNSERLTVEKYLSGKYNITVTGVNDYATKSIPSKFVLYQNYPNPFNPSTIINYSIPKASFVTLKIYDVLGKEIATLVNEIKSAGNYSVSFNGSNLPSGVYFYRMQLGSFVSTKKLLLLK
jgi:hypothetical protein